MYRQKDGVSMGSVLGPTMANIFVGFHEERLLSGPIKPLVHFRYVDDTFCLFNNQTEANTFFSLLNGMHPALKYTYEGECDSSLAFLDVLVTKTSSSYHTSIYRKPTFTGLYTRWDSFCPKKRKINLIWTLAHRALMICSKLKLDEELETITDILSKNGYPLDVIRSTIQKKLTEFSRIKENKVAKCPIYLRLPWLGRVSEKFAKQISSAVHGCYFAANVRVVFSTRTLLPSSRKDVLPPHHNSNVIYNFECGCGANYLGRTTLRLDGRIQQHVPSKIRNGTYRATDVITNTYGSSITDHLLKNQSCAANFSTDSFSIISRAHSLYHLKILETIHVRLRKPSLCKQRECLLGLNVINL